MLSAAHIRRRWKRYLAIGVLVLTLAIMIYTGFAADMGIAILARLPSIDSIYLSGSPEPHYGPASLEERIVGSDTIARVRLRSVSQTVEFHDYTVGETAYARALEFNFDVLEYMKGSGGNKLVAVAYDLDVPFKTSQGAALLGEDFLGERDTQWDDREAIIFLTGNHPSLPSTSQADRYWFGHLRFNDQDRYTLASDDLKLWLPAASSNGASGASSGGAQRFLTDVPSDAGAAGASGQTPTITLAEMKTKISDVDKDVNAGDGSEEYKKCIYLKYEWERKVRHEMDRWGGEYYHGVREHNIRSAAVSGSEVFAYEYRSFYVDTYGDSIPSKYDRMFWLEGGDKDLFSVKYPGIVSTVRPLIKGEYRFYFNDVPKEYIICDAKPEAERKRDERLIHVTAPTGTVHEAFFDPASLGASIGGSSGIVGFSPYGGTLKPAAFQVNNSTTTISDLSWQNGTVSMTLTPYVSLSGYALKIIELDGTVSLTLKVNDAKTAGSKKKLTWSVSSQPWHAGDKLMLRIETAPEIAISGLESSIAQGRSDSFTVSATNLVSTNSYTIRFTTDLTKLGFNSTCSTGSKDVTVPAGSVSHTTTLDLYGCSAPGSTLTAKLLQGSTTLDTATASVTVTPSRGRR